MKCITTAPSFVNAAGLLPAYRQYIGNSEATLNDLYLFITQPTVDRIAFLNANAQLNVQIDDNVVLTNYSAK